ncbi:MAG: LCP family protein [Patescibacteria group bacterium]
MNLIYNPTKRDKFSFFKKRPVKIAFSLLFFILIVVISFIAYIYAQGVRVFDGNFLFNSTATLKGQENDRINIALMGIGGTNHPGGQLTDSMMVLSIRPSDGSLAMISIPRDLYVFVPDHKTKTKINEVYSIGEKDKKGGGPELVKKTLKEVLGLDINYYVTLDFAGFEKFIDQIGGVDVVVEKAINDSSYPDVNMQGYDPFSIKAGNQRLDGKTALKYARSRHGSAGGDFDRAARQQQIVVAVRDKLLKNGLWANPIKIAELATTIGDHLRTDVSPVEIKVFAGLFKNIDRAKIHSKVLSDEAGGVLYSDSSSGTYHLVPKGGNYNAIQSIAKNIFEANSEIENVKIEIQNASGKSSKLTEVSSSLKSLGYNVVAASNLKTVQKASAIYDYSSNKYPQTLEYLKKEFSSSVADKKSTEFQNSDIVVVIGQNYSN